MWSKRSTTTAPDASARLSRNQRNGVSMIGSLINVVTHAGEGRFRDPPPMRSMRLKTKIASINTCSEWLEQIPVALECRKRGWRLEQDALAGLSLGKHRPG
eukprot:549580-Rhodomonas_salina.1